MSIQNIVDNCGAHEVRAWDMSTIDGFRLTKSSSFEPGALGLALSRLAAHKKGALVVQCAFQEPAIPEEFEASLLGSPFGISLIRHAKQITFGVEHTSASSALNENLTRFYRQRDGLLGKGQSCALVCVDPGYKVPARLRAFARYEDRDFPVDQSGFRQLLSSMAAVLGFSSFLSSATESALNSFIFECFVNSQEHGQSTSNAVARQGVRALLMEKVVISKTTKHDQLSQELQEYIARCSEAVNGKLGLGLVCLTIADQGDGIQNTLPSESSEEGATARFARAFLPGVTRKPQGEIKRGLGLSHALSAAHRMRARIEIHSSGVHFLQDFSLGESEYPSLDIKGLSEDKASLGSGTTVSIWVPEFASGLDQPDLFDRKKLLPVEPVASTPAP